jgi:hypothetical protein
MLHGEADAHCFSPQLVERIYEPNIIHNPSTWMGIWTPQGWRVHRKRWGRARPVVKYLSGDGQTTFFKGALRDPSTGRVEWQDDLHLRDDPFTDGGIYPSDPRVEYPIGQPRWAVSHTLLCYAVADHNLFTHEYLWDPVHGHLQTFFRTHVKLERAITDSVDGMTVKAGHHPISTTIEGNCQYPSQNSAVRGVWSNANKTGPNFYTQRTVRLMPMLNAVYGLTPEQPVTQCHGMYAVLPEDRLETAFDKSTGECVDHDQLIEQFKIPIDEPKLGMMMPPFHPVKSQVYEGQVSLVSNHYLMVDEALAAHVSVRRGTQFIPGKVGYAGQESWNGASVDVPGYSANFDINGDGIIDQQDEERVARHLGRTIRANLYLHAYFGGDWLTTNVCLEPEHRRGIPAIADYDFGGGYNAQAGIIHLVKSPGPNQEVWIEYFYDAPAQAGTNNIKLHLYQEY